MAEDAEKHIPGNGLCSGFTDKEGTGHTEDPGIGASQLSVWISVGN